jgi:hypothetical protein
VKWIQKMDMENKESHDEAIGAQPPNAAGNQCYAANQHRNGMV